MDKDHGLGVPKAGDEFHCPACGMELQITEDCTCSSGERVHFVCCGVEMHRGGKGERLANRDEGSLTQTPGQTLQTVTGDTPIAKTILFTCPDNASRSQIAEALARMFGGTAVEAYSAGPRPAAELDPRAVSFMSACGYDLSAHFPKGLGDIPREEFDVFVAVDGESVDTAVQARRRLEWNISLPDDCSADQFQEMGVHMETKVRELLESL